jgi:hypothetical protein
MARVLGKTVKGQEEIDTRAYRLTPRLRSLLIMVDGKRTDEALRAMLPQADEGLAALLEQGFVQVLASVTVPPPAPPPNTPPPQAAPEAPVMSLEAIKRAASHDITEALGMEGDLISLRIERAKSLADLQPLLVSACNAMSNAGRRPQAEAFKAKFLGDDASA